MMKIIQFMKNCIKKITLTRRALISYVCLLFPPLKWFITFKETVFYEYEREKFIFIKMMPKWYSFLETSYLMRILRVLMGLWLFFFLNKNTQNNISIIIDLIFNIEISEDITPNMTFIAELFTCFCFTFFSCFSGLKFILGIRYFKQITNNSHFSFKSCFHFVFRRFCNLNTIAFSLGLIGTLIDVNARNRGLVEPFDGYFQIGTYKILGRVTKSMGTEPSKDLELLDGSEFLGANYVREYGQMHTLRVQAEHAIIYKEHLRAAALRNN